ERKRQIQEHLQDENKAQWESEVEELAKELDEVELQQLNGSLLDGIKEGKKGLVSMQEKLTQLRKSLLDLSTELSESNPQDETFGERMQMLERSNEQREKFQAKMAESESILTQYQGQQLLLLEQRMNRLQGKEQLQDLTQA